MTTTKITLDSSDFYIVPSGFEFVNQSCVKFYGFRLSKKQLITCCEHFINLLQILGYSDRLKVGFNLKCFKYFELSVYLHGLISVYCSALNEPCPRCFGSVRFSRLPYEVLKPEKVKRDFEVALVDDFVIGRYYVCVINGKPICSHTLAFLQTEVYSLYPQFKDYNLNFIVK